VLADHHRVAGDLVPRGGRALTPGTVYDHEMFGGRRLGRNPLAKHISMPLAQEEVAAGHQVPIAHDGQQVRPTGEHSTADDNAHKNQTTENIRTGLGGLFYGPGVAVSSIRRLFGRPSERAALPAGEPTHEPPAATSSHEPGANESLPQPAPMPPAPRPGNKARVDALLDELDPQMAERFRANGHADALEHAPAVLDFLSRSGERNVAPFERFVTRTRRSPAEAVPLLDSLLQAHPALRGEQVRAFSDAFIQPFDHPRTGKSVPAPPLTTPEQFRAAIELSQQARYSASPEQAVHDLRALIGDNVDLDVARNELGVSSAFGEPRSSEVAGPGQRGPDLRLEAGGETVGREMYATDLDTPATATPEDAANQLKDGLMRGVRSKARDYRRPDVPPFTEREVAVQIRTSSGGFHFDDMINAALCEEVMARMRKNPDTIRHGAQDTLDRVRFYDSTGRMVYEWVRPTPSGSAGTMTPSS
jgi:hypothetical protein